MPVAPAGETPAPLPPDSAPIVVPTSRRGPARRRSSLRVALFILLGAACLLLLVWGGVWFHHVLRQEDLDTVSAGQTVRVPQGNFQLRIPGDPWKRDRGVQVRFNVNLVLSRTAPSNTLGLFFKDYRVRQPSEAEMVDEALGKLRGYFKRLQWEAQPKSNATPLGGRPALRMEFEGDDPEEVPASGECRMMAYRGIGYWFFTWGPAAAKEQVSREWGGLRQGFRLLGGREGWQEKPPETERVQGTRAAYQLAFLKGLWQRVDTKGYDPRADLVLLGNDPTQKPYAGRAATLQVLVLPPQPDLASAARAAREHLLKRQRDPEGEGYPGTKITTVKDRAGADIDRDEKIGGFPGRLSKLRVTNDESRERYVVLGVVNRPEDVLALVGDCDWNRRDFWDREFMPLLASLRPGK
jgi:hypothetical protein